MAERSSYSSRWRERGEESRRGREAIRRAVEVGAMLARQEAAAQAIREGIWREDQVGPRGEVAESEEEES